MKLFAAMLTVLPPRRGLESGLTPAQIAEATTRLGFYAGWGKATAAMTTVTRLLAR